MKKRNFEDNLASVLFSKFFRDVTHCHHSHISEKHMKKLHSDGLLTSFDFESYETCEACLLGKMTRTPFTGFPERASDLLELIHTDVCRPMTSTARG